MTERIHGGDWAAYEREYGARPLDFSSSVSPLGVPEGVRAAIAAAAGEAERYPDPLCRELSEAVAAHEGVAVERVLCGGGASDLIYRAVLAAKPRRALVAVPAFGEYEAALALAGCAVTRYRTDEDFRLNEGVLSALDGMDAAILCQPGNPAGVTVEPSLLRRVAARCAETGCRLFLDECFADFLDDPAACSMKGELERYPNVLIFKAFTKLYALAGVRLGYALGADAAFLRSMRRAGPPWTVSTLAQAAGVAALRETGYAARVRALTRTERAWLYEALCALGLRVVAGEANYLLFRCDTPLDGPLRERGILLRNCGDFTGLDASWYRVAVRTRADNERLVAALREVVA